MKVLKKKASKITKNVKKQLVRKQKKAKVKPMPKKIKGKDKTKAKAKVNVVHKIKGMVSKLKVLSHKVAKKVAPQPLSLGEAVFGPVDVKPYVMKANEEYMSKKQLKHFQTILLQWKTQLMVDVDRTMDHMKGDAANYPDPVDRASQEEEFSLELRTRDRERKLLKKIEEALLRINDHDYGFCDDCGAEIGIRRLEARPTATQCIECKTIAELREKQVGESN